MSRQSLSQQANDPEKAASFIKALHSLTDPRDNRGKRINLAFTVGAVVLAIMSGRSKLSSIHRYIWNKASWLRRVTRMPKARLISCAHLPRLLAIVPLDELNDLVEAHFGVRLEVNDHDFAITQASALRLARDLVAQMGQMPYHGHSNFAMEVSKWRCPWSSFQNWFSIMLRAIAFIFNLGYNSLPIEFLNLEESHAAKAHCHHNRAFLRPG